MFVFLPHLFFADTEAVNSLTKIAAPLLTATTVTHHNKTDVTKYGLETPSSCSGSIYLTPDGGCMTEINECYQSSENLNSLVHNNNSTNINNNNSLDDDFIIRRPIHFDPKYHNNIRRRSINKHLLNKLNELTKLCIVQQDSISIESPQKIVYDNFDEEYCEEKHIGDSKMSVTNSDFRSTKLAATTAATITQTPLSRNANPDNPFNVTRRKKYDLQNLSPKVSDLNNGKFKLKRNVTICFILYH